jgi:Fe-Mn family superoxide dismutase
MPFTLPPLPYPANALAGQGMQQETLELHHGKHHNAYVTALNGLIEAGLGRQVARADRGRCREQGADATPVLNQPGSMESHLFWQVMSR